MLWCLPMHCEHKNAERESLYSKQDIKLCQEKVCDVAAVGTHFCEIFRDALEWFGGKHTLLWQSRLLKGAGFTISPAQTVWTHLLLRGRFKHGSPHLEECSTCWSTAGPLVVGRAVWGDLPKSLKPVCASHVHQRKYWCDLCTHMYRVWESNCEALGNFKHCQSQLVPEQDSKMLTLDLTEIPRMPCFSCLPFWICSPVPSSQPAQFDKLLGDSACTNFKN